MSESKYLFDRVKKAATRAIEAERIGDFKTAFEMFLKAAELLNDLIALEKSVKIRDSYYTKAKEYIKRAKEIKTHMDGPKISKTSEMDLPDISSEDLPIPPKPSKSEEKDTRILPPSPPSEEKPTIPKPLPPPPTNERKIPPPPPTDNLTAKMMRGEDLDEDKPKALPPPPQTKPTQASPPPPKEKVDLPTKTTYELLYDQGKYRECIIECTKSVDAELRVRMGLFDEQLTLGMLIDRGIAKGIESLKEFKFVNILFNRIDHENYRPSKLDAERAISITTRILMS
ncbi:MAG: hypothetical protein ACFFDW_06820 [Candidatus Thorarchaeota archaeon]